MVCPAVIQTPFFQIDDVLGDDVNSKLNAVVARAPAGSDHCRGAGQQTDSFFFGNCVLTSISEKNNIFLKISKNILKDLLKIWTQKRVLIRTLKYTSSIWGGWFFSWGIIFQSGSLCRTR
jgi:hypothetical protein